MEKTQKYRLAWKALKWIGVSLLSAAFGFLIITPFVRMLHGHQLYYIQIVGNYSDSTIVNIRDEFKDIINAASLTIDNESVSIRVNPKKWNDHGDPDEAERIAKEFVNDEKTIFVVGHFYSSTTKNALPIYKQGNPAIPVLLTTETYPYLVPTNGDANANSEDFAQEYVPIYGLSADDFSQSELAADFAIKFCDNIWIIKDSENPVYSDFLAENFSKQVQEKDKHVMLISENSSIPCIETIESLNIGCIFFAGQWSNAVIAINQINAIYNDLQKDRPLIILSDGCVDQKFLKQIGQKVDSIYLTHPISADDYNEKGGLGNFGRLAANEMIEIIDEANNEFDKRWIKRWLKINRVKDVRTAITEAMERKYKNKYRTDAGFHLWKIVANQEDPDQRSQLEFAEIEYYYASEIEIKNDSLP